MKNSLPPSLRAKNIKHSICIICEGHEEYDYLTKLKSLNVWNEKYEVNLYNAEGNGNIPAIYQDKYQNGSCEVVFAFCDTDGNPYEAYEIIKAKINAFHGNGTAADSVLIFGNPCTMQIMALHWEDVKLTSHKKEDNAALIKKHTSVKNYSAKDSQREALVNTITLENYNEMKSRVTKIPSDDTVCGSSNFDKLLNYLSSDDTGWIEAVNNVIDTEG